MAPENEATAEPTKAEPVISDELKEELKKATGSVWKKVLWWVIGVLGVLGALLGIVAILKGKGPLSAAEEVIKDTKTNIRAADLDAKIKAAEAKGAEKAIIDKLKAIKEMKNEDEALKELAKIL